ncbi:hypothetical protein RclHR1_05600010 [Rhizophagus clarus]|uniref:Uncharacterized protein n=1 Tax=Rhizophagus clarus TaxID=94130 RepID=A0A2Z6S596_9GLOM|nr:hypothetical protein RclHR1_05600010 [Rhizophagus clarus]GES92547.1 hypothetical protein GLOIN_2v1845703 [Rhizophagus clarus]
MPLLPPEITQEIEKAKKKRWLEHHELRLSTQKKLISVDSRSNSQQFGIYQRECTLHLSLLQPKLQSLVHADNPD